MQYIVFTKDKDEGLSIRQSNREAHLNWLKNSTDVTLLTAGPWLDDEGIMRGSLLIVEAMSKSDVLTWLKSDPYALAGLPKEVTVKAFKWAIGAPT